MALAGAYHPAVHLQRRHPLLVFVELLGEAVGLLLARLRLRAPSAMICCPAMTQGRKDLPRSLHEMLRCATVAMLHGWHMACKVPTLPSGSPAALGRRRCMSRRIALR